VSSQGLNLRVPGFGEGDFRVDAATRFDLMMQRLSYMQCLDRIQFAIGVNESDGGLLSMSRFTRTMSK